VVFAGTAAELSDATSVGFCALLATALAPAKSFSPAVDAGKLAVGVVGVAPLLCSNS
jgi:hypothetical protein